MKRKYLYTAILIALIILNYDSALVGQDYFKIYDPEEQYAMPSNRNDDLERGITFLFYPYSFETLDLTHYRLSNPDIAEFIPSKISVSPPSKGWVENLVYGVTYLHNGNLEEGTLVLLLVGDHDSKFPKYFIDNNLDYNFNNDKGPYVFPDRSKKSKTIILKLKNGPGYEFMLLNPAYQEEVETETFIVENEESSAIDQPGATVNTPPQLDPDQHVPHIRDLYSKGFYGNLSFLIGAGKIIYDTPNSDYRVHYNPRGLSLNLGYTIKKFEIGFTGSFEATYYQTSFLQKEVNYFSNIDRHPRNKYSFGVFAGYHLPFHRLVSFQPYLHFGGFTFDDNRYIPDNVNHPEISHNLKVKNQYGIGGKFAILAGERSSFTIFGQYNSISFNPEGLFPDGSSSSNWLVTAGMGFSYKIF